MVSPSISKLVRTPPVPIHAKYRTINSRSRLIDPFATDLIHFDFDSSSAVGRCVREVEKGASVHIYDRTEQEGKKGKRRERVRIEANGKSVKRSAYIRRISLQTESEELLH